MYKVESIIIQLFKSIYNVKQSLPKYAFDVGRNNQLIIIILCNFVQTIVTMNVICASRGLIVQNFSSQKL